MRFSPTRSALAAALLAAAESAAQTPPAAAPNLLPQAVASAATDPQAAADYATRPVAYIYGNVPVTRQQLGEFLIARGGADKLELLVNKLVIETECQKRGVTVTEKEMEAALLEDLEGLSMKKADFVKVVLPRYGKTLYEWMEDVIRPKLLLGKLVRERVQVSDADLKVQFEREYGEKRRCQIIMWPRTDDEKVVFKMYEKIRTSQDEFERAARSQANPALAAAAGHTKPICRHLPAQERIVEDEAFLLKPGELSRVLTTSQGYLVLKLHEVIPADGAVKFDDVRPRLEKQAMDEKTTQEIPKFFAELKQTAAPRLVYDGPGPWRAEQEAKERDNVLNGIQPAAATTAPPPGK